MKPSIAILAAATLLAGCAQEAPIRKPDAPPPVASAPAAASPAVAPPAAAAPAPADAFWKDASGRPLPEQPNRKSAGGFGGWLLVTPDADWKQKWQSSSGAGRNFREAKTVQRGQELYVMVVLGNPALRAGKADVGCAVELLRPDGQAALRRNDIPCLTGAVADDPQRLYLATPVVGFKAGATDAAGTWTVRALARDKVRGTQVLLATQFTLQ